MEHSEAYYQELACKWAEGTITPEEAEKYLEWYNADDEKPLSIPAAFASDKEELQERMLSTIRRTIPVAHRVHFLKTSWFRYAAAVLLLLGGAAIWYGIQSEKSVQSVSSVSKADIAPGTNRAILTVGNKTIDLATNKTGIAVGNVISYTDGKKISDAGQMLQLTTPRAGQYQAILPDGSKVWLNAASSIKFPSKFNGDKREVEITGEAYLEIAKNTKQPFFVRTNKSKIQVLGTSFNVNAYEDEGEEKTTLIEGSVKVMCDVMMADVGNKTNQKSAILKPGEQAIIQNSTLNIQNYNSEAAIAWKNGLFTFNETSIEIIMRQLARWYNLEVVYEGKVDERLVATIPRNLPVSKVLKMLELTKAVHFTVEGNRVIVKP